MAWSWTDIVDLLVKLSPAASIVGALIAARVQFRNLQRINAETIAKNYYRSMLKTLFKEIDLVGRGNTREGLALLRADERDYGRYKILFGIVAFAMQEVYFAMNAKRHAHWATVIRTFMGMFRHFLASEADFTHEMDMAVHPEFGRFVGSLVFNDAPIPASAATASAAAVRS